MDDDVEGRGIDQECVDMMMEGRAAIWVGAMTTMYSGGLEGEGRQASISKPEGRQARISKPERKV